LPEPRVMKTRAVELLRRPVVQMGCVISLSCQ
jgi:hypothetical protein